MDLTSLLKMFAWLAAVGLVVLIGARLLGATARKASSALPA